jgi:hypothetical protein
MPVRPPTLPAYCITGGKAFLYKLNLRSTMGNLGLKNRQFWLVLLAIGVFAALSLHARAQSTTDPGHFSNSAALPASPTYPRADPTYMRPTEKTKLRNYFYDAFGPFPISGAAVVAGINQIDNSPPEWQRSAEGYGKRFASDFGIAAVTTTTRYAMAEAFREDTLYYRCQCTGFARRLRHAVTSVVTSRRGDDGHRVFSFPSLVAPYAGTMTAVYSWYPKRFDAMDGFRMGNYNLLGYVGANIALEFIYSGPHSLLNRMHLTNTHGAPDREPNP